ncbi:hypothetical protein F3Y22_tig00018715pilonHSYRG00003 [Hibiscus syriacus]|uniref:ZF-HD dimerization-type domain-containing protein n=1 Tax=Hibiscus syriacus TaxID=106335 RepID=A0A6A3BV85_HIBSY|nr:hypothetical protein F3Y22_tig00018715pilonHSYRG00003 [Hibiscus syriacus]
MELTDAKTTPYAQSESSSETHPTNNDAKTKSLSLLFHQHHHPMVVSYRECLKNHAASLGGHALDGCGEFMSCPTASPTDLNVQPVVATATSTAVTLMTVLLSSTTCHRHRHRLIILLAQVQAQRTALVLAQPIPHPLLSLTLTTSAPHMLLALSTGYSGPLDEYNHSNPRVGGTDKNNSSSNTSRKKRSRTKFSKEQKERCMLLQRGSVGGCRGDQKKSC